MTNLCDCGCGNEVRPGHTFLHGHWSRTPASQAMRKTMRTEVAPPNPSGLCMCGCGEKTAVATNTRPHRHTVEGQPLRYLPGHHMRGKGEQANGRWRGGRWVHRGGYVYVYRPDHPNANAHGYVYEHRIVMEEKLGRLLTRTERVHHINNVKTDNRPENLELFGTQGEHSRMHEGQRKRAKAWEAAIVAVLLDAELLERTIAYVRQHNRLPELDALTSP